MGEGIILVGGGGHCKSVVQRMKNMKIPIMGIIDLPERVGSKVLGVEVLGTDADYKKFFDKGCKALVTIGSTGRNDKRAKIYKKLVDLGFELITFISDHAIVSNNVVIGAGTVVLDGAIVNADVTIGENCIINTGSIIEHDCKIGASVHLASGSTICGNVSIDDNAFLGFACSVKNGVKIGKSSVVGGGAVVLDDVPPRMTVAGVPAKIIESTTV